MLNELSRRAGALQETSQPIFATAVWWLSRCFIGTQSNRFRRTPDAGTSISSVACGRSIQPCRHETDPTSSQVRNRRTSGNLTTIFIRSADNSMREMSAL